jgi:transcriptional regulator with PAS, ATPase and Fis domain
MIRRMGRRSGSGDTLPGAATKPLAGDAATPAAATEPAPKARLVVVEGPDAGATIDARRTRALIGTHPACDLVLADAAVSRFHVEIGPGPDGRQIIRDLDSLNGTRLDGVPVIAAPLAPGQVITIGTTRVRFGLADTPLTVPVATRDHFGLLVGRSPAMARTFGMLERAAGSDATVLLLGETGTGKEAAAESIHRESDRKDGPFIVVDCGALPPTLLESELFGHERGAFTGADTSRDGAFQAAHGGTIFLDEIGELPLALQPKLLRVLERREVKGLGRTKHVKVDVRIIAATHRDLRAEVNAQRFRADLYYRLAVLEVTLPPLRAREGDLPVLVERLLEGLGATSAQRAALGAPSVLAELASHSWSGNVRELRNYLERRLAFEDLAAPPATTAEVGATAAEIDLSRPLRESRETWLRPIERRYLAALVEHHRGNLTAAARAAGVDRITLYRLLWKHGLRSKDDE